MNDHPAACLHRLRRWCAAVACGIVALSLGLAAYAQDAARPAWPVKPVRLVVPYPAGGATDILARHLSRRLGEALGQSFVVENRSGANGNIGAAAVAAAPADGYTLMFSTTGPLSINKLLYKSTSFDPVRDFTPVILVADVALVVAAHPSLPVRNIPELIAHLKANPGKLSYSSPGNGSMGHLAAELMQRATGTRMTHVPYKGSAPAVTDLLAGVVPLSFDLVPAYLPHVQSGKARAVGILGNTRTSTLQDVATLAEAGIPAYASGWFGLVGPAGLRTDTVDRLNGVVNEYLASSEGRARLAELGLRGIGGKPADLGAFVASEIAKWKPIVEPLASIME